MKERKSLMKKESNKRYWIIGIVLIVVIGVYLISQINFSSFLSSINDVGNLSSDNLIDKINFWDNPVEFFFSESNSFWFMVSIVASFFGFIILLKGIGVIGRKKDINDDEVEDDEK